MVRLKILKQKQIKFDYWSINFFQRQNTHNFVLIIFFPFFFGIFFSAPCDVSQTRKNYFKHFFLFFPISSPVGPACALTLVEGERMVQGASSALFQATECVKKY